MSSRREAPKPIKRVRISVRLNGDRKLLASVSKETGAKVSRGSLSLEIEDSDPGQALEKIRALAASIKRAESSKDFK